MFQYVFNAYVFQVGTCGKDPGGAPFLTRMSIHECTNGVLI